MEKIRAEALLTRKNSHVFIGGNFTRKLASQIDKVKKKVLWVFKIFDEFAAIIDLKDSNLPQLSRADVSENARKGHLG